MLFFIPSFLVYAANFGIGDTVEVFNTGADGLVVRGPNACDAPIGGKFDGARGTVLTGAYFCSGYNRWKIRWSDGLEGWSAENWMTKVSITPSTKFNINDKVKVTVTTLKVRSSPPELAEIGSVSQGIIGTVIDGSFYGVPKGSSGFFHFWKVNYGSITGWSAEDYLDKISVPNPPTHTSPPDGSTITTTTPTFQWNPDPNADYHGLYIRNVDTNVLVFDSEVNYGPIYGSSFTLPSGYLQDGSNYRWNMRSKNNAGWSSFTSPWYFSVKLSQCSSGPCCDTSTGTFRPSTYKCQEDVTTEYACPWGTACSADVGVRHQDRYCSGSSAACDGSLQYDSWTVADDCTAIEVCQVGNSVCVQQGCGKFKIGDTIKVTSNVNVRTGPGTSYPEISDPDYIGYAPAGTIGVVLEGPQSADGYIWWKVDFGPGKYSGWSIEDALALASGVTAAIDQKLLDLIDQYAPTYYKPDWNINIEQFKAWIATIARAEGNKGGYGAHSQGSLGTDVFNHKTVGSNFRFSSGIGPFQLDRGSSENWDIWPTIDKLDPEKAVKSVMNLHYTKFGSGATLDTFSKSSPWFAVNPNYGGNPGAHFNAVTGQSWDSHKNGKVTLDWSTIKSQLAQNANDPIFLYENNVKSVGSIKWNIKDSENIMTDSGKKVIFDGYYQTWLTTARSWSGTDLFKYYYTYDSNQKIEVLAWDNSNDPTNKFRYIFVREYSTGPLPENVNLNVAGETLTSAALTLVSKCTTYPGIQFIPAHTNGYTTSNRESTYDIRYIVIHTAEGSYSGTINWFQNPAAGVSAHYVISKTGNITAMVCGEDIAYHAGNWEYNKQSIGIEHEGFVSDPNTYTQSMYQASADLAKWLLQQYNIPLLHLEGIAPANPNSSSGIVGHNQVPDPNDPSKGGGINHHTDPGTYWNWTKYMALITGTKADGELCSSNSECQSNYCEGSQNNQPRCCSSQPSSDGWYGGGNTQTATCGNVDNDAASLYRDYYCTSSGISNYETTNSINCNSQDSWYGGSNNAGCGNDPASYWRDYYVNTNSNICDYTTSCSGTNSVNCDSNDICLNTCDNNNVNSYKDYYVIINTNACAYQWGPRVEVCQFACSNGACVVAEICNNGVDDDNDGYADCSDADCPQGTPSQNGFCCGSGCSNNGGTCVDASVFGFICSDGNCNIYGEACQNSELESSLLCSGKYLSCAGGTCEQNFGAPASCDEITPGNSVCEFGGLFNERACEVSGKDCYLEAEYLCGAPSGCDEKSEDACSRNSGFQCEWKDGGDNVIEECELGCGAISLCDEQQPGYEYASCSIAGQTYFADRCSSSCKGEDRDNICRSSAFAADCTAAAECNGIQAGTGNCSLSCSKKSSNQSEALLLYGEETNNPSYRIVSGGAIGNELNALDVGGQPDWIEVASSSNSQEIVMVTLDEVNDVNAQVWNGDAWGSKKELTTVSQNSYSAIDVEYLSNGNALVAFVDKSGNSLSDTKPHYSVWNGISWSAVAEANSVGAIPNNIELASNPNREEMILVSNDAAADINAQLWNGNAWENVVELTANAFAPGQPFDVDYESVSGDGLIVYTNRDSYDKRIHYRIVANGIIGPEQHGPSLGDYGRIYNLIPNSKSDEIILMVLDNDKDTRVLVWNGNSWSDKGEVSTNAQSTIYMSIAGAYLSSGNAFLVYSDNTIVPKYRIWDGSVLSAESSSVAMQDTPRWMKIASNPAKDELLLIANTRGDNIDVEIWDGSSWSKTLISTSDTTSARNGIGLAYESFT